MKPCEFSLPSPKTTHEPHSNNSFITPLIAINNMFKYAYLFFFSALLFVACNEKKTPVVESGLTLPPNVIEVVDQRYPSDKPNEPGVPRKATYIDTTSNEKIMERAFYKNKKVY